MKLRSLTPDDIPDVLNVQREAYPAGMLEAGGTFAKKMGLFPAGCLGCWEGTTLAGYVFSHPWQRDIIVPLDANLTGLPDGAEGFYVHDLVVAPPFRGQGVSSRLWQRVLSLASETGAASLTLVAVRNSEPFWERQGFTRVKRIDYAPDVPGTIMTRLVFP